MGGRHHHHGQRWNSYGNIFITFLSSEYFFFSCKLPSPSDGYCVAFPHQSCRFRNKQGRLTTTYYHLVYVLSFCSTSAVYYLRSWTLGDPCIIPPICVCSWKCNLNYIMVTRSVLYQCPRTFQFLMSSFTKWSCSTSVRRRYLKLTVLSPFLIDCYQRKCLYESLFCVIFLAT